MSIFHRLQIIQDKRTCTYKDEFTKICIQGKYIFLLNFQGNKFDSALSPTCQPCFCLQVFVLAVFSAWNPCAPAIYRIVSHYFQVFAQVYLFNEVYPDRPNLKLQLTLS